MPALELGDDVAERQLAHREQQQQVIDEIGRLGRHARLVLRRGRERELDAFLAELLRDLQHALRRELRRVAAFGRVGEPLANDRLQLDQECRVAHGSS